MPIYEYHCDACGEAHEALRKISDPVLDICPQCGQSALRKKVSAAAFRLKGGGWYETDFKQGGNKKNLAGDKTPSATTADKSGDSTKAAAKGKPKKDSAGKSAAAE